MADERKTSPKPDRTLDKPAGTTQPNTQPSEEWGERLDDADTIARGGKTPGGTPRPDEKRSE